MPRRPPFARLAVALTFAIAAAAHAASTTYVATYGSDANVCSLVQPCRSFAGALAQTSGRGEILVLDSGGYGPLLISDKSVSIVAPEGDSAFALNGGYAVYVGSAEVASAPAHHSVFTDNTSGFAILGWTGSDVAGTLHRDVFVRNGIEVSVGGGFFDNSHLRADASSSVFSDNHTGITVSHGVAKLTLVGNSVVRNAWAGVENDFDALIESRGNNTLRNNATDGGPFAPLSGL